MGNGEYKTYHRVATTKENQSLEVAVKQINSQQIWGKTAYIGSAYPTVRAFYGPLPDGEDGIEFKTDVETSRGCSTPSVANWKLEPNSPQVRSASDPDFAFIDVIVTKIRYKGVTSLTQGVDLCF